MGLEGRVAIVTGAAGVIGKAISLSMARKGAIPVVVDINESESVKLVKKIKDMGISTCFIKIDFSNVREIKKMTDDVLDKFGKIDILVNNVGILETLPLEDITEENWESIMSVNLKSTFFACQQVLSHMKYVRKGRIINISSVAGRMGSYAGGIVYGASKAGIIGLTMSLARKVAEYNITVNAVAPGPHESEMIRSLSEERRQAMIATIPLRKLGKPENLAEVIAFLASDSADFITGAMIDVNGGMYMG